uniref:Uncharacterized protein n=1 Tax=Glossina austeni TaxID=7395 RepID=A0A1A9VQE6_GLOAU
MDKNQANRAVKGGALLLMLLKQMYPNLKITIEDYVGYGLTRYEKLLSDENIARVKIKSKEGKIFLIQLENKIKINSNAVGKLLLPKRKYQDGAKCVIVGPGHMSSNTTCYGVNIYNYRHWIQNKILDAERNEGRKVELESHEESFYSCYGYGYGYGYMCIKKEHTLHKS